jgi:hypothetical protein
MRNLMEAKVEVSDIKTIIASANDDLGKMANLDQGTYFSAPQIVAENSGITEENLPVIVPKSPKSPEMVKTLSPNQAELKRVDNPALPVSESTGKAAPVNIRKVPQVLAPGQQADPARPMPVAPTPYSVREPGENEFWMGVREETKPDGHRVEVNTNGQKMFLGDEVLSRPSGRKVHRYYSGSTERLAPEAAKGQENSWENMEQEVNS